MEKISVTNGVFWVEVREANLRILCGCPADSVKHLMHRGLILPEEKNGVHCETGPNAILLSESFLQNGHFTNLAEFPILQMLYRQGFIVPDHPNNDGTKPLLIGRKESIEAQSEYILRGNYGLISMDEMIQSEEDREVCERVMRYKKNFAFDNIRQTEELIDSCVVNEEPVEIRNGVFVQRLEFNVYKFSHAGETVVVDLNLKKGEEYKAPYQLSYHKTEKEYFSIIHSGEGDGWDKERPCMGSIITFQGKIYLVDAGPNLLQTLRALGIGTTEIEGVFMTHAHDDHFNGLTALMGSDHRVKFFATPLVRHSVVRKFCSLLGIETSEFQNYFHIQDIKLDEWNDIEGLEVRPVMSPHPVETSILFFRTLWGDGYKSYAHFADLASFDVLQNMMTEDAKKSGISREYLESVRREYLTPTTIKKVDVGGGMIHGDALDFRDDSSEKILLSHVAEELNEKQREIGSSASFGASDVLIPATQNYGKALAYRIFQDYYPSAPNHALRMLLNCESVELNPGTILIGKGEVSENVYFVLSGILEFLSTEYSVCNRLSVGSMAGELSVIREEPCRGTFRALSHASVLKIPKNLYHEFLKRHEIIESALLEMEKRMFLLMTWLIGEVISCPLKNRIARAMGKVQAPVGWTPPEELEDSIYLLESGKIHLSTDGHIVSILEHGNFFGEENIITTKSRKLAVEVVEDSVLWRIPGDAIRGIPIIHWKMTEAHEKRMKRYYDAEESGVFRMPDGRIVDQATMAETKRNSN